MREINSTEITNAVSKAVITANLKLPEDLEKTVKTFAKNESGELASSIFAEDL